MRLLIVEDDSDLAEATRSRLASAGFTVDVAATAAMAFTALRVGQYDLAIIDLSLPDGEGGGIVQWLRRRRQDMPILIASALDDPADRVRLLNGGADDYLVKPFTFDELQARVRALLRRPAQISAPVLACANIRLTIDNFLVEVGGMPIDVPRQETMLLAALMRSAPRPLPRTRIEEAIYSFDQEVTGNAVEAAVSRLRRRLRQHGADVTIKTVWGFGYALLVSA